MNEVTTTTDIDNQIKLITVKQQQLDAQIALANLMADARVMLPNHLHGKPADCLAIALQAQRWDMDCFAVAQKTHLVNGTLGYESQLVNAVISRSTATKGRFKYEYYGDWEAIAGKVGFTQRNNKNVPSKKWNDSDEKGLWCRCGAVLAGEDDITWGEPLYLGNILTRNSPLWVTAPKQQLAYLAVKYWSRLYTPDVLLGVYDKEDLEQAPDYREEKEINPAKASAEDLNGMFSDTKKEPVKKPPVEPKSEPELMPRDESPTEFEVIKNHVAGATDAVGFNEAIGLYNNAQKNNKCSHEELIKLADLLQKKRASLNLQ